MLAPGDWALGSTGGKPPRADGDCPSWDISGCPTPEDGECALYGDPGDGVPLPTR